MRTVVVAVSVALGVAATLACNSATPPSCEDGRVMGPDGSCIVPPGPYCQPCAGNVASELPAFDCYAEGCTPPHAYAVCTASCWSGCSCTLPPGYTLIDAGFFASEAGDGAEPTDAPEGPDADASRTHDAAETGPDGTSH
jgi:hypothetical protein